MAELVSATELEIMNYIWDRECAVKTREIFEYMSDKNWHRQTLNTFLGRLKDKGMIERKQGLVIAALTRKQYDQRICQNYLDKRFDGSLSKMIIAYAGNEGLDADEADRMIHILKNMSQ